MISRLLLSLLVLGLAACRRPDAGPTPVVLPTLPVTAVRVEQESWPVVLESPATVRPAERASLAARLTGTVSRFPFGLGQAVAAGDILLVLHAPETEARVQQTQAQLAEAQRNADRARTLVEKGVNAPDSLRDAEDRLRYAQAATAEAEALLSHATVRAPFAGVITEKNVLPGDLATPGVALLVLESTQHLRAEGSIPEQAAASLRPGDTLPVLLDSTTAALSGRIEEISAAADNVSRTVLVKVALPAGTARSGQFARLQVTSGMGDVLLVPATAVSRFGQMERVFVIEQGRASLRLVKSGRVAGDRIEILSGLTAGETLVARPPAALRDGQPVTLSP